MKKTVSPIYSKVDLSNIEVFEESEIRTLPTPVQKYLLFTNSIGKDKVKTVKLKQTGLFNVNGKKWTPITAEQYFNVESKEFIWKAKAGVISVVDKFVDNKGSLKVKLLRLIKLGEEKGEEIDQGEILRYLSEIIWYPSAFTSSYIKWEAIDDSTSKAVISYGVKSAFANFHFSLTEEIEKITAKRYGEFKGKYELNDWEISNLEYKEFNGIVIPYKAHVTWKLDEGDLCYYKFEITDIEYNDISAY